MTDIFGSMKYHYIHIMLQMGNPLTGLAVYRKSTDTGCTVQYDPGSHACCGGLMLYTFEGCHTGPNQYDLRLACILKRTFDHLKHV